MKKFNSKLEIENELCHKMVEICHEAIQKYGSANLLLSGGTTPLMLYKLLGEQDLDFSKLKIGLVDERYVPYSSEFNNQKNIEDALNGDNSKEIKLLGLANNLENKTENLQICAENYAPFLQRIDFCLLGMGEDGHTASIFPNDPASNALLEQKDPGIFYSNAPSYPHERISCNKSLLMNAMYIALMLIGSRKIEILKKAREIHLPVAHFTEHHENINIYFSEK